MELSPMFFNLLQLVFAVVSLWIALKAKPLGPMPYHWGTWVGMQTAGQTVLFVIWCVTARLGASLVLTAALYILALMSAIASCGILRRRAFGVVALVCTYLLWILSVPFVESVPGKPYLIVVREAPLTSFVSRISLPTVIGILFTAVYVACTVIYFNIRWPFMKNKNVPGDLGQQQIEHKPA
jgi:hypothetical protein